MLTTSGSLSKTNVQRMCGVFSCLYFTRFFEERKVIYHLITGFFPFNFKGGNSNSLNLVLELFYMPLFCAENIVIILHITFILCLCVLPKVDLFFTGHSNVLVSLKAIVYMYNPKENKSVFYNWTHYLVKTVLRCNVY